MNKSKNKILTLLLLFTLVIAGCTQPEMLEEIKTITPPQKNISAVINLPGVGSTTRTIVPGDVILEKAVSYKVTLENVETKVITTTKEPLKLNQHNQLELENIAPDSYNVTVEGLNSSNQVILKGTSTSPLVTKVNEVASTTIKLKAQYGPNMFGTIQVTFDWTSIIAEDLNQVEVSSTSAGTSLNGHEGPISQAVKNDKYLKFFMYIEDDNGDLIKHNKKPIVWDGSTDSNSFKVCDFTNVKTGTDLYVCFSVLNKNDEVLINQQYGISAQVYADQTSYFDGNPQSKIILEDSMDKWYTNISNIEIKYPTEAIDKKDKFYITWNDLRTSTGIPYTGKVIFSVGKLNVEPGMEEERVINPDSPFIPEQNKENKVVVDKLTKGTQYYVKSIAYSKDGRPSDTILWTKPDGSGFMLKVDVNDIIFSSDVTHNLITDDSFLISATVDPIDATYQNLTWSSTAEGVLEITPSPTEPGKYIVMAKKPGVSHIAISNNDPDTFTKITTQDIKVTLKTPENINSQFFEGSEESKRGIAVTWTSVPYAEKYIVHRVDGNGATKDYETTSENFLDTEISTSSKYKYQVKAIAPENDKQYPGFKSDSTFTEFTSLLEVKAPNLVITTESIPDNKFNIADINGSGNTFFVDVNNRYNVMINAGESKTIGIVEEIPGMVYYEWRVNNKIHTKGTYEEANSIVLSQALVTDPLENAPLTVTFKARNADGVSFSAQFIVSIVTRPVTDVDITTNIRTISPEDKASTVLTTEDRFRTNLPENTKIVLKGNATHNGQNPSINTVFYRVKNQTEDPIATIDKTSGVITINKPGEVIFEAYSPENNISAEIPLNFYTPSVASPEKLVTEVNKILGSHIASADTTKNCTGHSSVTTSKPDNGDWWQNFSNPAWTNTLNTVSIQANLAAGPNQKATGGITYKGHKETVAGIGDITMDAERILVWARDKDAIWYSGRDPLELIGKSSNDANQNKITVTLPNNQGKAYITYHDINTIECNSGRYTVTFQYDIYVNDDYTIKKDTASIFGVVDEIDQQTQIVQYKGIGVPFKTTMNH